MTSPMPVSGDSLLRDRQDFSLVLGGPLFQLLRRAHLTDDALELVRQRIIVISRTLIAVLAATLTLLGLIIGFSFSMAISRYDQRKNYEEAEANAIGTEYVRADLLPAADAAIDQGEDLPAMRSRRLGRRATRRTAPPNPTSRAK